MSRARHLVRELLLLALISCGAAALIAALVALAVGALAPEAWPTAFLQSFPIFWSLLFAGLALLDGLSGGFDAPSSTRWRCRRCSHDVVGGRCGCSSGPSPWEPAS